MNPIFAKKTLTAELCEKEHIRLILQEIASHRAAEAKIASKRRALEEKLASHYRGDIPDEGAKTFKDIDGYAVTFTQPVVRRIVDGDVGELALAVGKKWIDKLVRYKFELDVSTLRKLQEADPELYNKAAQHIIAKPGALRVSIKEIR